MIRVLVLAQLLAMEAVAETPYQTPTTFAVPALISVPSQGYIPVAGKRAYTVERAQYGISAPTTNDIKIGDTTYSTVPLKAGDDRSLTLVAGGIYRDASSGRLYEKIELGVQGKSGKQPFFQQVVENGELEGTFQPMADGNKAAFTKWAAENPEKWRGDEEWGKTATGDPLARAAILAVTKAAKSGDQSFTGLSEKQKEDVEVTMTLAAKQIGNTSDPVWKAVDKHYGEVWSKPPKPTAPEPRPVSTEKPSDTISEYFSSGGHGAGARAEWAASLNPQPAVNGIEFKPIQDGSVDRPFVGPNGQRTVVEQRTALEYPPGTELRTVTEKQKSFADNLDTPQ